MMFGVQGRGRGEWTSSGATSHSHCPHEPPQAGQESYLSAPTPAPPEPDVLLEAAPGTDVVWRAGRSPLFNEAGAYGACRVRPAPTCGPASLRWMHERGDQHPATGVCRHG